MKKISILLVLGLILALNARADLALDHIQFDPAIISSGDQVDIVAQFHDTATGLRETRIGDPNYQFKVTLESDDTLTKDYVLFQDVEGHDIKGVIYSGELYNKRFTVKIADNAPAANYGFKLVGQWYYKGVAEQSSQYLRFTMPVKKVGVALSISNIITNPERVRSGDKNILLNAQIYNSGEKNAKNVNIRLYYPEGITASYTNNNQMNLGVVESMQSRNIEFFVDTDKFLKSGTYALNYTLDYQDLDSNGYTTMSSFPFVVKKRPNIIVLNSSGVGVAGEDAELMVLIKNVGEEKADAVDVRVIKQSSQPFEMDVRSSYIGQLRPGESATAVFTISVNRDAELKKHGLNLAIRAKGDSEEGDSNVYTYSDSAVLDVATKTPNNYPTYAAIFLGLVIVATAAYYMAKKK